MRVSPFTQEHQALRSTIRRWIEDELVHEMDAWEAAGRFPDKVFRRAGELGFLGLSVPEDKGGAGGDYWATVVWGEEIGRAGLGGLGMALTVQTDMATPPIAHFGTPHQIETYLKPALAGEKIAAIGISEPEAGSDVRGVRTRAVRDGDHWVINGSKMWITNGDRADFVTMVVRTAGKPGDADGVTLFLVDTDLPGFDVVRTLDKLGMRCSDTAELSLVDVRVPHSALLGEEGQGFRHIMWQLQGERMIGAISAIGGCERMLGQSCAYAAERHAFGRPIGSFQVQRHRLAEMATRLEATKRMVYEVCDAWNRGRYPTLGVAQVKLAGARLSWWMVEQTMQIHGGYGYAEASGIPRAWRDARLIRIGGGADEVQLEVISKLLHLGGAAEGSIFEPNLERVGETPAADVGGIEPLEREEHEALRQASRAFVSAEITANVEEWEAAEDYPRELFATVGGAGFLGLKFDEAYGGSGEDFVAQKVWVEELARCGAGGLASDLGASSDLAGLYLARAGSEEQKQRWLAGTVAGELIGGLGVTEPDAGSDVNGMRTRAVRDGDGWVLNGAKTFITNGSWADYLVVAAKTDPDAGHGGVSLFIVDGDAPGVERQRLKMLGWRTGHTGELSFTDVRLDADRLLGAEGSGFYAIMQNFAWERVMMALGAVVAAEESLKLTMRYGQHREAFGRPIGAFQTWRHRYADLATRIAEGRALTDHAIRVMLAGGEHAAVEAAKAKLYTQRLAVECADWAVQIHGGTGYVMDVPAQRWLRDARLGPIGGGTDEIMAEIIGRSLA